MQLELIRRIRCPILSFIYPTERQEISIVLMPCIHTMFLTSGIFTVQQEFDDKYAFTNLGFMQYMLDLEPNEYSGMEISLKPNVKPEDVQKSLQQAIGNKYIVQTRYEQNQSLYTIMQIEKWVIYGILSLILLVAAFNMIGALTMLVLEKQKDIAVLKAMGAHDSRIQQIFLSEGLVLAGVGGAIGTLIAFLVCMLQLKYHLIKLGRQYFYYRLLPCKNVFT